MSFGTSSPASLAKNCAQRKEIMELCSTQARTHTRTRNDCPARICSPRLAAPQLSLTLNSGVRGGGSVNTMIIKACHLDTPGAERMAQLFPAAVLFRAAVSVWACMSASRLRLVRQPEPYHSKLLEARLAPLLGHEGLLG